MKSFLVSWSVAAATALSVPGWLVQSEAQALTGLQASARAHMDVTLNEGARISGLIQARNFLVPEGATVLVEDDLVLEASGSVRTDGVLQAKDREAEGIPSDGVRMTIRAQGRLTVSGQVLGGTGGSVLSLPGAIGSVGGHGSDIVLAAPQVVLIGRVVAGTGGESGPHAKGPRGGDIHVYAISCTRRASDTGFQLVGGDGGLAGPSIVHLAAGEGGDGGSVYMYPYDGAAAPETSATLAAGRACEHSLENAHFMVPVQKPGPDPGCTPGDLGAPGANSVGGSGNQGSPGTHGTQQSPSGQTGGTGGAGGSATGGTGNTGGPGGDCCSPTPQAGKPGGKGGEGGTGTGGPGGKGGKGGDGWYDSSIPAYAGPNGAGGAGGAGGTGTAGSGGTGGVGSAGSPPGPGGAAGDAGTGVAGAGGPGGDPGARGAPLDAQPGDAGGAGGAIGGNQGSNGAPGAGCPN